MPIHTPLRPNEHAILGRSFLTIRMRIIVHQPGHHRFGDLALLRRRWIEEREIEQSIRVCLNCEPSSNPKNPRTKPGNTKRGFHRFNVYQKLTWDNQLNNDWSLAASAK